MNIRQFARRTGLVIAMAALAALASAAPDLPPSIFFVENAGQWDGAFRFRASLGSQDVFLTETGMTLNLMRRERPAHSARNLPWDTDPGERDRPPEPRSVQGHVLRLTFLAADPCPVMVGQAKLASYSNYFLGRDSRRWKSRVGHYQRVLSQEVWPGIDVEYVLTPGGVELVYHLQAGADPAQIQIQIEGLQAPLAPDAAGNLIVPTSLGPLVEQAPSAFQNGRAIPCRYRLSSDSTYRFELEGNDPQQELLIDPLLYSTYFGGNDFDDDLAAMAFDSTDRTLLVGGSAGSNDFPITPGAYQDTFRGHGDLFVSRFAADDRSLLFSTYLGGAGWDDDCKLLARSTDILGATRTTESRDWPLTTAAIDTTFGGVFDGAYWRLSADGTQLLYSSYWGGLRGDYAEALQSDSTGRIYLGGTTDSPDFPVTATALYPTYQGSEPAYISVFDSTGTTLLYSTFFPGDQSVYLFGIVVPTPFRVWLYGSTHGGIAITPNAFQSGVGPSAPSAFLTLLDLARDTVVYSSYFGNLGRVHILQLLPLDSDRVLLAGNSENSADFPVSPAAYDTSGLGTKLFVTQLALPATVEHSTLLGSPTLGGRTRATSLVRSASTGRIWVGGSTTATDFLCTADAVDAVYTDPAGVEFSEGCIAGFTPALDSLVYGSYLGGSSKDVIVAFARESNTRLWVGGYTTSVDFLVTPDAYQTLSNGWGDGFFSLLQLPADPVPPDTHNATDPFILHPSTFGLSAYPNPFNGTTTLRFTLPAPCNVTLTLYDLQGREAWRNKLGRMPAGIHRERLRTEGLASGFYFARLTAGEHMDTQRLLLLR